MKKYHLYLWIIALVGLVTSCSQDETDTLQTANDANRVTLTASLPEDFAQIGTRALPSADGHQLRCILEVWTRDPMRPTLKQRIEQVGLTGDNVVFDFKIEEGTYDCLFWADFIATDAASDAGASIGDVTYTHYADKYYTTNNTNNGLRAISIIESAYAFNTDARDAFFGHYELKKQGAAVENPSIPALTRPFAKLTIKEKDATNYGYCSGLTAKYDVPTTFNTLNGTVGGTTAQVTCNSKSTESQTLFSDYIFTDASSTLGSIALTFTAAADKELLPVTIPAGIPLKRNYKTNATGSLISEKPAPTDGVKLTVTMDAGWTGTEEKIIPAKVGDYFYADGTWGTAYINDASNACIGIVFEVNADGKSGKIVSLDETTVTWATSGTTYATAATSANNVADGTANMAIIKTLDDDYSDFPVFKWCADKTEGGLTWYLPAPHELQDLYAATCGLKIVDANPQDGEVERWNIRTVGGGNYMENSSNYKTQRTAFKEKIIAAGGTEFSLYFSSCEDSNTHAMTVECDDMGTCGTSMKTDSYRKARAIAKFPKP